MNTVTLPPKRYEEVSDPKYDPIRFRPWFASLGEVREKIPALSQAWRLIMSTDCTFLEAANEFSLEVREVGDYIHFRKGIPRPKPETFQHILNGAYELYCELGGARNFREMIRDVAPLYGVNPFQVIEMWETDSTFYPTGYCK